MPTFEDRLLVELLRHRTEIAAAAPAVAARPGRRRPLVLGAAALVAAAGLTLPGLFADPAFAISTEPDGSVRFTLMELRDLDAATRALNDAGVPAVVREASADCTDTTPGERAPAAVIEWPVEGDEDTVRIHPASMPARQVLGLTALRGKFGDPVVKVLIYDAPGPSCFGLGKPNQK